MNLNKVFVLGRVTADPILKSTATGMQVVNFSVATNRVWNNKAGSKQEETEFHNIVAWGKQAEIVGRFLKKGGLVLVEGRLQTRTWDDKSGQKRKTTEIVCEKLQLGPKPMGGARGVPVANLTDQGESVAAETIIVDKEKEVPIIEIGEESEEIKEDDLPF